MNGTVSALFPLIRLSRRLLLFGFRGIGNVSKLFLTLYVAHYLGLADLGVYGLVAAAGTISPAFLGFGLTDWVVRHIVMAERAEALRKISTRLVVTLSAHLVFQPLIWMANLALGSPVPPAWIWLIAPVVLLEHIASDANDLLTARGHIKLTTWLQFIRAALWPLAVLGVGMLFPQTRTLDSVLVGWLMGLVLMLSILVGWLLRQRVSLVPRSGEFIGLIGNMSASVALYVRDVTGTASLFIDRYLISFTLGLELTGVYVFFWSVANVVHGMINFVILQPQAAVLIGAVAQGDIPRYRQVRRHTMLEATAWTVLMSVVAFVAVLIMLPLLQRTELQDYLPIFGLILAATWARVWADEFGFCLLALHRDGAILIASVSGALASAILNLLLIPGLGLLGAALAFLLTGLLVLALRHQLSTSNEVE